MSLPVARRPEDETAPSELEAVACPRCRTRWPANEAPAACPNDGAPLAPRTSVSVDDNDPMVGRTLEGRYTILAKLGAGSMGTVYRAKQHAMGREVAIKILRGDRAADEAARSRFMREARANSLLASPNTVTVFDFGQSESGEFYLAMELLEGESLGQRLTRVGRLPPAVAVDAARQALRSLGEAHAKGIIHRDLKPDNLFFARVLTGANTRGSNADLHEEIVKVLDFGIAKMINPDDPNPLSVVETQAGTVFGTPRYMSPEQAQGKPLDARSDLYSLAVILYQMLTGRPPFTDNDAVVVMARHIKSMPKRPNEAAPEAMVPPDLEEVVMRTLAKDPNDRPLNAEVLAGELLAALEAHNALTSGVRTSITNAAGIRVPESMRPPPVALPKPKSKIPIFAVAAPVIVIAAFLGVYLGLARSRPDPKPAPSATPVTIATNTATPTTATATSTTSTPTSLDPPSITPDALPSAGASAKVGPKGRPTPPVATNPRVRPASSGAKPPESGGAGTAPTSTSTYGKFE